MLLQIIFNADPEDESFDIGSANAVAKIDRDVYKLIKDIVDEIITKSKQFQTTLNNMGNCTFHSLFLFDCFAF